MSTTPEPPRCHLCDVYADVHVRCPVTVSCPQCGAPAGRRCRKPDGSEVPVGSHARRNKATATYNVVQLEREKEQNRRSGPTYSTGRRCGHAIKTDCYDDSLSACQLAEGHDGDHTDYCHVWQVRSWSASQ